MAVAMIVPYRTNQKQDANDAEASCEAVSRPRTRFVLVKSEAQQAVLTVHRARELLVSERTALANQIRRLFMGYGIVIAQGIQRLRRELSELLIAETLPELVREVVGDLRERLLELDRRITEYDQRGGATGQAERSHASVDVSRGRRPDDRHRDCGHHRDWCGL
jgi:transposase